MNKIIRTIALLVLMGSCCLSALSCYAEIRPKSDLIIFGDSLSDTGNYPEPYNVSSPTLKNFNLYVPVSNPVPYALLGTADYPSLGFLSGSLVNNTGKIDGKGKENYSINWPLFFAYHLGYGNLMVSGTKSSTPSSSFVAINYAWASSRVGVFDSSLKSLGNCYHDDGSLAVSNCKVSDIISSRQKYLADTKNNPNLDQKQKYAYPDIVIPNLQGQIQLYFNDYSSIQPKPTTFIVYTGLNDIGKFFKDNVIKIILAFNKAAYEKNKVLPQVTSFVDEYIKTLSMMINQLKTKGYQNDRVYVMSLPHISNFYEVYNALHGVPVIGSAAYYLFHKKVADILDYAVDNFNTQLQEQLQKANLRNVHYIDLGHEINQLAVSDKYKNSIKTHACAIDSSYLNYEPNQNNCSYPSSTTYYFSWNNAHFTAEVNRDVAKYLESKIAMV